MTTLRLLPGALAATVLLSSIAAIAPTFINPEASSQVAQAAELQLRPNQDRYARATVVQVRGRFSPNETVKIYQIYTHEKTRQDVKEELKTMQASERGTVQFDYQIPGEGFKDNVRIVMEGGGRSQAIRIPIGGNTPSPSPDQSASPAQPPNNRPSEQSAFPKTVSSGTTNIKGKDYMDTEVTLSKTASGGLITGKTVIWTENKLSGFTGGVDVALLDQNNNILHISELHQYGVNGKWIPGAPSSRTELWNEPVPQEAMAQVSKIAIVHRHTPKDRLPGLIKDLKQLAEYIKTVAETAKVVIAIFGA